MKKIPLTTIEETDQAIGTKTSYQAPGVKGFGNAGEVCSTR